MRPIIVAELSSNHSGSLDQALALVDAASKAGADAIKFQTFTPEQMVSPEAVIQSGPWAGRNALELYREAHTPRDWHAPLFALARELGMEAFSSVFHPDDVDFLEELDCPRYKIASFELTDLQLIRYAARTGKPIILSTGMATWDEINVAWEACQTTDGAYTVATLLKCTSAYPALPRDANLATMDEMKASWPYASIGLSDHTLGHAVAVAATALGATMIEKHLTLSRAEGGLDSAFSMEPFEFAEMVKACHEAADAIGIVHFGPLKAEADQLQLRRMSGGKRA